MLNNKDTSVIPFGQFCYSRKDGNMVRCPYWDTRGSESQNNGYCHYLEMGDSDMNFGLLWDQVKECGINNDY